MTKANEGYESYKPQREVIIKALYPSMPDTQSIAWRSCEKEVSGMVGYEGHISRRNQKRYTRNMYVSGMVEYEEDVFSHD